MLSRCFTAALLVASVAAVATAQTTSLGALAEQERVRRGALAQPGRVYTADDLRPREVAGPRPTAPSSMPESSPIPRAPANLKAPRFAGGALPAPPVDTLGGGAVRLELTVGRDGRVAGVKPLRQTTPFTELLVSAVRGWTFTPAEEPDDTSETTPAPLKAVESTVLVVGLFRPPALMNGGSFGEPVADVAAPSPDVPAAADIATPLYPPTSLGDGVVLTELTVGTDGRVGSARTLRSAAGFDEAALAALRATSFRPARVRGETAERYVYVVSVFRQPVLSRRR